MSVVVVGAALSLAGVGLYRVLYSDTDDSGGGAADAPIAPAVTTAAGPSLAALQPPPSATAVTPPQSHLPECAKKLVQGEKVSASDVKACASIGREVLRNIPFARHGRPFRRDDLREYFEAQSWYHAASDYDAHTTSSVDLTNVSTIDKILARRGPWKPGEIREIPVKELYQSCKQWGCPCYGIEEWGTSGCRYGTCPKTWQADLNGSGSPEYAVAWLDGVNIFDEDPPGCNVDGTCTAAPLLRRGGRDGGGCVPGNDDCAIVGDFEIIAAGAGQYAFPDRPAVVLHMRNKARGVAWIEVVRCERSSCRAIPKTTPH